MKLTNTAPSAASRFGPASVLMLLTLFSGLAFADSGQGKRHRQAAPSRGVRLVEVVLDRQGKPVANATIRVCQEPASETPCTPEADLFQDKDLTIPAANPTLSDRSGLMAAYVRKGQYRLQVTADGMENFEISHVEAGAGATKSAKSKAGNDENTVGNVVILQPSKDAGFAAQSQEDAKIAPDLSGYSIDSDGSVSVVVQFKQSPDTARYAEMLGLGTEVKQHLDTIKAMALRVPVGVLTDLLTHPEVAYVSPDRTMKPSWDDPLPAVMADVASQQYGFNGAGIGIAVIDSGVYLHSDLKTADGSASRIVYSESFVPLDASTNDTYGHGTHVAGILASNGRASTTGYSRQYLGVAPRANIINLRVLDGNGGGTDSQVIAAIQRAIQLKNNYNIRVINLSVGRPVFESYTLDPLDQAVEQAWKAGIVVVVAAGNSGRDNSYGTQGYATIQAPGNDPNVITVGSTKTNGTPTRVDDYIASYSSKGPTLIDHIVKPDLVAPGNRIISNLSPGSYMATTLTKLNVSPTSSVDVSDRYLRLSGTSMAAPVVSGGAALLIQQNPAITPDQVKARLMKTAWKGYPQQNTDYDAYDSSYFEEYDIFTIGAGYLDLQAALGDTTLASGGAASPTAVNNNGTVTLVNSNSVVWGNTVVWGQSMVWGQAVVWGQQVLTCSSVVWGNSVVWGQRGTSGYSVLWGQSVVWGQYGLKSLNYLEDGEN